MFPNITISSKNISNNLGLLCESLLFFDHTNLILDARSLPIVLKFCGYDNIIELVKSKQLSLKYSNSALGVGDLKGNNFMIGSFKSQSHPKNLVIKNAFETVYGNSIQTQNHTKHFIRIIEEHNYSEPYLELLTKELEFSDNIYSALAIISENQFNKSNTSLRIEKVKPAIYNIESNIDKKYLFDAAFLVATGAGHIYDAEKFNSGLAANSQVSNYTENKIIRITKKRKSEEDQISNFHEFVLPNHYDLRGTINSGAKQFNDFMYLWNEATKFKSWLKDQRPSLELLQAYIRKISETTWLDKLPSRNIRWLIFAGLGGTLGNVVGDAAGSIAGGIAGIAVNYFDDFILEKLLQNWKPNQFVDGEYIDFLHLRE